MKKRIFLTAIWAYVAWYGAVFVAAFLGIDETIGPLVAVLVGGLIWFEPIRAVQVAQPLPTSSTPTPDGVSSR